ncbi:MAG: hypothetical protein KDA47_11655 [Planctomycetales bacterium]|nr:hypothetical protein [Planctomycetales bacterium]
MTDYDHPWKEALDVYLDAFFALCYPSLYREIDWSVAPKMLDKELQQITPVSEQGPRTVDKLVEVRLLNGESEWLLIHLEVQSQATSDFARRMFVYFYRLLDKYDRRVLSLAVLGDDSPSWRPSAYRLETFDCRVEFEFPIVKLLDFEKEWEKLERSTNPIASIVLAHLATMRTVSEPDDRYIYKMELVRALYSRGLSADEVRQMFRLIDWMMDLPAAAQIRFRDELEQLEKEKNMPYVTSIERLAREEGVELGLKQGREQGLERGLTKGIVPGNIQLLEQLLAESETSKDDLRSQSLEQLQQRLDELQERQRSRG